MNDSPSALPGACAEARKAMEEVLDGPIPAGRSQALRHHLLSCDSCREVQEGLRMIQAALRGLLEIPFPDDALEEVWSRTVSAESEAATISTRRFGWRAATAMAAATLLTAVLVTWTYNSTSLLRDAARDEPTFAEIEQAAREARQVLELTAQTLHRSRQAALEQVLEGQISPALRRIPIQWPESPPTTSRRSKT